MVRADYCGDGRGHPRDGMQINVYDRLAIQVADPISSMTFEAAWGADGVVCVHKMRVPDAVESPIHRWLARRAPGGALQAEEPRRSRSGVPDPP